MSFRIKEADQDVLERKQQKDKQSKKFPKVFKKKVDMSKVNVQVIQRWISVEVDKALPDDDIVADYLGELLVANNEPDVKSIHLQMADFLGDEESLKLCTKLWELLVSAQDDKDGIPQELVEAERIKRNRRESRTEIIREKKEEKFEEKRPKTNYNRSQYNASKRTRSPERGNRSYRERD
ncbi:hypothetical protein CAAN3_04S01882 [[Candida] anglica]